MVKAGIGIQSKRLLLRRWKDSDLEPFAALNADPEVMRYFPTPMTRQDSDAFAQRIEENFERDDFGLWAIEVIGGPAFIGFTGLSRPSFEAHFTPAVEIGWRLARSAWGHGYATEAASASLAHGFDLAGLREVVSFTSTLNTPSQRVMQRLGMSHDPAEDFEHPRVPPGDPLRPHVLYRLTAESWYSTHKTGS